MATTEYVMVDSIAAIVTVTTEVCRVSMRGGAVSADLYAEGLLRAKEMKGS